MAGKGFFKNTTQRSRGLNGVLTCFPVGVGLIQRTILKHSYYIVYFVQETKRTLVVAVLDGRRDPDEITAVLRTRKRRGRP